MFFFFTLAVKCIFVHTAFTHEQCTEALNHNVKKPKKNLLKMYSRNFDFILEIFRLRSQNISTLFFIRIEP